MGSFDLKPTLENIIETYLNDSIGRSNHLHKFLLALNSIDAPCSIAINSPWGSGKTFFVKHAMLLLQAHNQNCSSLEPSTQKEIVDAFSRYMGGTGIEMQPQVCVYFDAWINDNDVDPLLSLIYAIAKTSKIDFPEVSNLDFIKTASAFTTLFTGKDIEAFRAKLEPENLLKNIEEEKSFQEMVKEYLDSLLPERGNRLVIFIDELDRCKPSFSVQLLERIKHYFENDRITFVFSTNIEELQHTIKAYYGQGFNATKYFDKFFDLKYNLPTVNREVYWRSISRDWFSETPFYLIEKYNFSLREMQRYSILMSIVSNRIGRLPAYRYDNTAFQLVVYDIVPLALALQMHDHKQYSDFINGSDSSHYIDLILNSKLFLKAFLEKDADINSEKAQEQMRSNIEKTYHLMFPVKFTYSDTVAVGQMRISNELSKLANELIGLLSEFIPSK